MYSIVIVTRDGPLKLQEQNRMVFAHEGTATFTLCLVLFSAILIAIVDLKRLGHALSNTVATSKPLVCTRLMSQSKTGDCDQVSDSPLKVNELTVPIAEDKEQTQECPPTAAKESETEEVTSETDTMGTCESCQQVRQDESEASSQHDTKEEEEEEMGRSKRKGRERGAEAQRLLSAEPVTFPNTLDGFGYFFNEDGKLKEIGSNAPFNFFYSQTDETLNQRRYEALGEVVTEHVYKLLEEQEKLRRVPIPDKARKGEASTFFFVSEDALTNPDRLLVLIHGSGAVRAGQWARRLIINDCLDSGSQLPFIRRARENGYGVVVMNTNDNSRRSKDGHYASIRGSGSPDEHAQYVWEHCVNRSAAKRIDIVAHSYGGCVTVTLAQKYSKMFQERVGKIAFTDSAHSLGGGLFGPSKSICKFLVTKAVNWVSSHKALGMWLSNGEDGRIPRVSAGTLKHEETSWFAFEEIFRWFLADEDDEPMET